jgi:hypothetical protein
MWCLLLAVFAGYSTYAQDLGNIGTSPLLKVNGGISASAIAYTSNDVQRRNPFSYYLNGNINFSLYGWSIPLSFSYSNRTFSYMQPFNQFSLHPKYKWVTAHLGWSSMSFSPYTLNGQQFMGAGLELTPPGKWKYSVLYGRFQRAVQAPDSGAYSQSAYQRMGYGFKVAYEEKGYSLAVNLFRAKDDTSSLAVRPVDITPQENIAAGVSGGVILYKGLRLTMEYAVSVLTRDIRPADSTGKKNTGLFMGRNGSTNSSHAVKASLNYTQGAFGFGVGYERIDPQYRTLGAYYSNNDYQNLTMQFTQGLFKQQLVLGGNVGVQQDDLDHKKVSNSRRLVSGLNAAYQPAERLQIDASYSNFQSYTNIKPQFATINQSTPYDNLDTLNYTQISQQAGLNINYQIGENKQRRQQLNVNLSVQDAADKQGDVKSATAGTRFYNVMSAYNLCLVPSSTTIALALNLSCNSLYDSNVLTWGPTLVFNRPFWQKKVRINSALSYNATSTDGRTTMDLYNIRAGGSYALRGKHIFNLSLLSLFRHNRLQNNSGTLSRLREFTTTAGYSYSF